MALAVPPAPRLTVAMTEVPSVTVTDPVGAVVPGFTVVTAIVTTTCEPALAEAGPVSVVAVRADETSSERLVLVALEAMPEPPKLAVRV